MVLVGYCNVASLSGVSLRRNAMVLVEYRNLTSFSGMSLRCEVMVLVEYRKVSSFKVIHHATHKPWHIY